MKYLTTTFSLNMLSDLGYVQSVTIHPVSSATVARNQWTPVVGHEKVANALKEILDIDIPVSDSKIKLRPGDSCYVFCNAADILRKDDAPVNFRFVEVTLDG